jgi:DinB superfamily
MSTSITLKQVLLEDARATYLITERLFHRVVNSELLWKPTTGRNWMTVGQLLMHCANFGCGKAIRGFVKGDWDLPKGIDSRDLDVTQHVPAVGALPSVESVEQALDLLGNDRRLALSCIREVEETELLVKRIIAPWGGSALSLFQQLALMIAHLAQHKGQLFYYLKLMDKDLNTSDLWGV